jgi:hypothetical protein
MNNQMLIVDSIENELIKVQDDKKRVQDKEEFDALLNDCGSLKEIRTQRNYESSIENENRRPKID